ncbi:MAG: SsrA-binding protein SmpB [Candidatus Aureabacteria bacterium]|nr:SsrA-binding protein SmpB [Candidatus Auribacterota bacterium]
MSTEPEKIISTNRRVYHDYLISENLEAGLCLKGTEIKSLRTQGCRLNESFVLLENGEAWLCQMEIPEYAFGNRENHEPMAKRKLLLHKRQLTHLKKELEIKNLSCIPLKIYLKRGLAKVLLGIGRGKKLYDKRQRIKKRAVDREIARETKKFR